MGSNRDVRGIGKYYAPKNRFRNRVAVGQYKKYNIKIMLGSGSELGGVRVWRVGPFFIHTLELRFKRQIFMIFIVDYIFQKGFLKKFKFVDNPFNLFNETRRKTSIDLHFWREREGERDIKRRQKKVI